MSTAGAECNHAYRAVVLDSADPGDRQIMDDLRLDGCCHFLDTWDEQVAGLRELLPPPSIELLTERRMWVYYPWRRTVVAVLGRSAFRRLRFDRNRNLLTAEEQELLGELRVGVVGLSVGHSIAHSLAAEGVCGELRLADFDTLELSNLNRVPATVFDLGLNKAVIAARRIAELDPYVRVEAFENGLSADCLDGFLTGLDVVIDECDSLDVKMLVREAARARGLPVLMATSARGMVDIERFDIDATRPILHGYLGDLDARHLAGLSTKDKVPHVLRILEGAQLPSRLAASMVEVSHSITTWPQRASEVTVGAAAVTEVVRRIALGEALPSGRMRLDVAEALDHIDDPLDLSVGEMVEIDDTQVCGKPAHPCDIVAAAAMRAPSGANAQPWRLNVEKDALIIRLADEYTSTVDVACRGSAAAIGAALFNSRIAAAAQGILGPVALNLGDKASDLTAVLRLDGSGGERGDLAHLYEPMLNRETNRNHGTPGPIAAELVDLLTTAAAEEGGRLHMIAAPEDIAQAAAILADSDRIRYLTPRLHEEMFAEVKWQGDRLDSGIDARTLGLDSSDLAALEVLQRNDVLEHIANWDAGGALGTDMKDRVLSSAAVAVISVRGETLIDYVLGGAAMEAVWIAANQHGLGVQPVSPTFLYANCDAELQQLSQRYKGSLGTLRSDFRALAGLDDSENLVVVLRLSYAPPTELRSQRAEDRVRWFAPVDAANCGD